MLALLQVALITRRQLRRQAWKVDAGWLGNRRLQELWAELDRGKRLGMCRQAKGPAPLSPAMWEQVQVTAAFFAIEFPKDKCPRI